jgi:two-component system CheB/CheR fusion protein
MMRIQPYYTLAKVIEGAVITFINITEMRKARDILLESENLRRLAAVVHDSNDAVSMQDMQGRILIWNPAAERIYGWTKSEALEMNIRDRLPEKNRTNALLVIQQFGLSEVMKPHMTQRLTRDGRVLDVWLTATSLVNETGGIYAIVTTERPAGQKDEEKTEV